MAWPEVCIISAQTVKWIAKQVLLLMQAGLRGYREAPLYYKTGKLAVLGEVQRFI
mgnify:CR=1 FL=1